MCCRVGCARSDSLHLLTVGFVLFSPLALFATMQAQSPSRHSHKSSKTSGSSKGTKRARKTGSHPEKTGSHPEKANKDLTVVASEPTGAMSSEGASAFEAKKNERNVVCQESLSQAPAESPTKKRKACTFLCGSVSFQSPDPVNPERDSIRWAYDRASDRESKGEGASCWYCWRAWAEIAQETVHRDRSIFQKDIAKDKSKLEAFLKRREGVIARTRSSLDSKAKRAGGMKRVSVHTKEFKRRVLEKPSDDFWPLNRYRKRFGSPSRKENKRLGHKKCLLEGHPGVLVPGDDGLGPWKVRTQEGREIAKEESEDVGSSGGEEDVAETKFEDLKKADDENYAAVVQGAMSSILQGFELDEEQCKEEDSRIARRQALRKKAKKKTAASSQAKRRKVNARFFESDDEDAAVAAENAENG